MIAPRLLHSTFEAFKGLGLSPGASLSGLPPASVPLVLSYLSTSTRLPVLAAFDSDEDALAARDVLLGAGNDQDDVPFYPRTVIEENVPPGFVSPLESLRYGALARLATTPPAPHFLCSHDLLEAGLPSGDRIEEGLLTVRPGELAYDDFREWLEGNEYEPVPLVTEPGSYALRGSIIDVYPVNEGGPVRLDFYGDQLEEIREFDIHSQISTMTRSVLTVLSLAPKEAAGVSLFDHFPGGWVLARQEGDDRWALTSSTCHETDRSISLEIDLFESRTTSLELLRERWNLLLKAQPSATALFVGDRESLFDRAAGMLDAIPLEDVRGGYPAGFSSAPLGLYVLTPRELFQRPSMAWRPPRKGVASLATVQHHIDTLDPGDPIIHVNHGIGRYEGLTHLKVGDALQECLVITYQGGDRVYVSTDKISLVFPYTAKGDGPPQLDALNSGRWERVKRQTRRSAEEVVDHLAELYARRSVAEGIAQPLDDELQAEMEDAFPYQDTVDQARATEEIKRDMERPQPMDRLLCGDVGFGKTEVALRAAFKAIRGGGQVAFLAPTTILVNQHLISFRARLASLAVNVGMLSRFVAAAEQRRIIRDISSGAIDLVVGTHRLLSNDITFKQLTLLIIDEEHRFGVKQKERMKELKSSVDVLSLTATPVPRTLHFSLAGIRDISHLDTPPLERVPIITSIQYHSSKLIQQAVAKEIQRGGQVYFVHNEVESIYRMERGLMELLPDTSIGVAHGQLGGKELEQTMLAFSEGRFQLLLCTSIIESGIDLPNVNTVIINNAHKFGLAQLYQIRGRVGRSNRQAYAYLLIKRRPKLKLDAAKRLKTIARYSALGSGYAISLRDLEIRGTGNLFGLEQSGHVAAVGLDLYTKIIQGVLRERELATEHAIVPHLAQEEVTVRMFPNAQIPVNYVSDPHLRLNLYRRLATMDDLGAVVDLRKELHDRFGAPTTEVENLLRSAELRILAARLGVRSLKWSEKHEILLDFAIPSDPSMLLERINTAMEQKGFNYRFLNLKNGELRLSIQLDGEKTLYSTAMDSFVALAALK